MVLSLVVARPLVTTWVLCTGVCDIPDITLGVFYVPGMGPVTPVPPPFLFSVQWEIGAVLGGET